MGLEQSRAVQQLSGRRAVKVNLEVLRVLEPEGCVAKVVGIGKGRVVGLVANLTEALNVASASRDNVGGRFGVVEAGRILSAVVNREEALGVMDVAKDAEIDAVFVEQGLKSSLALRAGTGAGGIPRTVAGDNDPGSDGTVDRGKIGLEELKLLLGATEGAAVEARRAVGAVGGVGEVGLGVDHDNVSHSILKREPERRSGQLLGLVGVNLGLADLGGGGKGAGHVAIETGHEVGKVLLTSGARPGGVRNLLASSLVVAGADNVGLTGRDGLKLAVKLLKNGLESLLAVKKVLGVQSPVIGVCQVAGVDDEFVVVGRVGEAFNSRVVERGRDVGDDIALRVVLFDCVAVFSVNAKVDNGVHGKGSLVTSDAGR